MKPSSIAPGFPGEQDHFGQHEDSNIICLTSCLNTGTHYLRMLLETSPDVDYGVHENSPSEEATRFRTSIFELRARMIRHAKWHTRFLRTRLADDARLVSTRSAQHKAFYGIENKKVIFDPKYRMFTVHPNFGTVDWVFRLPFRAYVMPVRHPILSICSIYRRFRGQPASLQVVIAEYITMFREQARQKHVHKFIVNPWENGMSAWEPMFHSLCIEPSESTVMFSETNPLVNNTDDATDDSKTHIKPEVGPRNKKFAEAKKEFLETGRIPAALHHLGDAIAKSGVIEIHKKLCEQQDIKATPI